MKRLITLFILIIIISGSINAQFIRKWERSAALGNIPGWFSTNNNTGGMAFSVQNNSPRLYVISNRTNPQVVILNPFTGDSVGTLNTSGISGGIYALNDLTTFNNYDYLETRILGCNLTDNASQSAFKIYMWQNETSAPQVIIIDSVSSFRLGDHLNAYRWLELKDHITTASSGNNKILDYVSSDSYTTYTRNEITLSDGPLGANASADYNLGSFYVNSDNQQPKMYFENGTLYSVTPGSVISNQNNALKFYYDGNLGWANPFYVTYNYITNNVEFVQTIGNPYWGSTTSLGSNPNPSHYGDVDYFWRAYDSLFILVLAGNNGIGAYHAKGFIFPVELTSFTASNSETGVLLEWITATELNNKGFEIEKSIDNGNNWNIIGFVDGNGTSTEENFYSFTDIQKYNGKLLYRLKQIDYEGTFSYSDVVEITTGLPAEYSLLQNYPNPFNPSTTISYSIPEYSKVVIKVFNILGKEISVLVNEEKPAGKYNITWNALDLPSGLYFYRLITGSFAETKQMMLIK